MVFHVNRLDRRSLMAVALVALVALGTVGLAACRVPERRDIKLAHSTAVPHWAVGRWQIDANKLVADNKVRGIGMHPMAFALAFAMAVELDADGRAIVNDGIDVLETRWSAATDNSVRLLLTDRPATVLHPASAPDRCEMSSELAPGDRGPGADDRESRVTMKRMQFGPSVDVKMLAGAWEVDVEASTAATIRAFVDFGAELHDEETKENIREEISRKAGETFRLIFAEADGGRTQTFARQGRKSGKTGTPRGFELWRDCVLIRWPARPDRPTPRIDMFQVVSGTLQQRTDEVVFVYKRR